MTCPHCGAQNPDGTRFCNSCGKALVAEAAPLPSPPAAPPPAPAGPPARRGVSPVVIGAGVAVAVLLLGVLGWVLFLRDGDDPAPAADDRSPAAAARPDDPSLARLEGTYDVSFTLVESVLPDAATSAESRWRFDPTCEEGACPTHVTSISGDYEADAEFTSGAYEFSRSYPDYFQCLDTSSPVPSVETFTLTVEEMDLVDGAWVATRFSGSAVNDSTATCGAEPAHEEYTFVGTLEGYAAPSPSGATTGATGATGSTGAVSELPAGYDLSIAICDGIDDALNCVDEIRYNEVISSWLIPISQTPLLYAELTGVQAGDVLTVEYLDENGVAISEARFDVTETSNTARGTLVLFDDMSDLVPATAPPVEVDHSLRVTLNGQDVTAAFSTPLSYSFCDC
jgi:hypothetical protein